MLTRKQLKQAIRSGGFTVAPHSGRYDMLCSAATDPYTQCGFSRIICLSHLSEFELHHLPNAYLHRTGLAEDNHLVQINALYDILREKRSSDELFATEKPMAAQGWNKDYYECCRSDLVDIIPSGAQRILSVGCGSGDTEALLIERRKHVTAIPLDSVIGCVAERRGLRILPPDFGKAFEALTNEQFDAILLSDVLQHVGRASELLTHLVQYLHPRGVLVGSVPNLGLSRRLLGRSIVRNSKWRSLGGDFADTYMHCTDKRMLKQWFKESGLRLLDIRFEIETTTRPLARFGPCLAKGLFAPKLLFAAGLGTNRG
jgi:2-polyprenyl-3-methyl-5-hydroxy-6-metoxy-1,4-benzoquinol methylase